MAIIEARNVVKRYPVRAGARAILGRGGLGDLLRGRKAETFEAIGGVSLSVEPGESLGIIGSNGSGKSTLLKILAGVTLPSEGEVLVQGRVASLLELGAGFHPMLTGRENIYLNAGLLGMRHAAVNQVFDQIVAFSEIGEFIDQPVDTYSSGMYVRIAFSVAVHTAPDIFLVDEVLAVGDEGFQRKCRVKIGELKEQGKTIVFVSHDLGLVNALCDRVVLLSKGKMISRGSAQDTIQYYLRQVGRAGGIHAMREGAHEAVFSHGRIALFRGGKELTAPMGASVDVVSLGAYHSSMASDWTVASATEAGCTATAEMPRLPVRLDWTMRIEGGKLRWGLAIDVQREVEIEQVSAVLAFPQSFTQWHCVGRDGRFPEILPSDLEVTQVLVPELKGDDCVLEAEGGPRPVRVQAKAVFPYVDMALYNSSYMTGARFLNVTARIPADQRTMKPQRLELMEVSVDFDFDDAGLRLWLAEQESRRTINFGTWRATLREGHIELWRGEERLTASIHLHTQICAEGLWTLSMAHRWALAEVADGKLTMRGACKRIPADEIWELWPENGRLRFRVTLDSRAYFECAEQNTTIALVPAYDRFDLGVEQGAFPPFDPAIDHWVHANHDYSVSDVARASGAGVPAVELGAPACAGHGFHMTALNTGFAQGARILQAMRLSEREGALRFPPGVHVVFDGHVAVAG